MTSLIRVTGTRKNYVTKRNPNRRIQRIVLTNIHPQIQVFADEKNNFAETLSSTVSFIAKAGFLRIPRLQYIQYY